MRIYPQILLTLLLYTATQIATAVTLPIKGDTYIASSIVTLGAGSSLQIDSKNKTLLDFNLSALPNNLTPADIEKATLVFFVNRVTKAGQIQITPLNTAWNEQTANSKTQLTINQQQLVTSPNITAANTYNFVDITGIVKNWINIPAQNFGVMLQPYNLGTTSISLVSKEAITTSHPAYIELVLKAGSGLQGLQGDKGDKGDKGDTGLTGAPGSDGLPGAKGDTGMTGATGPAGPTGLKGDKGDTGPAGALAAMAYKPGDTGPGGGIIIFVDYFDIYPDFTYLEAAPTDLPPTTWCSVTDTLILGPTNNPYFAIGAGKSNTIEMLNHCVSGAAVDATNYISTNGTDDWYLPSPTELSLMSVNLRYMGKGILPALLETYWASSSYDALNGSSFSYGNGLGNSFGKTLKTTSLKVWPIRSF